MKVDFSACYLLNETGVDKLFPQNTEPWFNAIWYVMVLLYLFIGWT